MRTTVAISDELLVAAKERAQQQGGTLGDVIDAALRRELAAPRADRERPPLPPVSSAGGGVRPGVDLSSNRAIYELLDEGLPFEKLR